LEFEFDERKSAANKSKHGIDFVEVQALWEDVRRLEVPARTTDEERQLVLGVIGDKHWAAVVTHREGRIRIISARGAQPKEIRIYEGEGI
jgi:uncharacterized DUF497 family protein